VPELPEVETFVRLLQPAVGKTIHHVDVLDDRLALDPAPLRGATIGHVARRGKYIVLDLKEVGDLVIHLRMSGRLKMESCASEDPYTRMILHLRSGGTIRFVNPRRLGTATHYPDGFDKPLGIDPTSSSFTPEALKRMTGASRAPIKHVLMDQQRIAGLGNIYAAEALWHAALSPEREARSLNVRETDSLHRAILDVLHRAVDQLGTTLGQSVSDYQPTSAVCGSFQNELAVYGRDEQPCRRCGTQIRRISQAGRSTCFCPTCQV